MVQSPTVDVRQALAGQDILSVSQFQPELLAHVFRLAQDMRAMVAARGGDQRLAGKVMAAVFYEPSTRTSASFIAAMERLGGGVIPITQGVQFSSVAKGETLSDTMRTLEQYADVIVLRHPEVGSAGEAAAAASVPVINAGDGAGEHPTQALLDLYTILNELGTLDGLHVAMVGDLRFGRTVHSLTRLLSQYDVRLSFVSPEILRLPLDLMNEVRDAGKPVRETYSVADVIADVDVLYVTRVQKERFTDLGQYEQVKDFYAITPSLMEQARRDMIVMHPLPRITEIDPAVDEDPRAAYFRQMQNGMFVRMALLAAVLGVA
jgi:carbamoyl-phosphate synthase/aspartate carbamoyltransferase/dihydroorotase/carbamoyl-phosphate synthase/aspartate carbamoyltransferase